MVTWSIRPDERALTGALAGYFFLVVAALYLMKPARNSLFLDNLDADRLPFAYIATALVTWGAVAAYVRLAPRTNLMAVIQITLALTLLSLVGFWVWFRIEPSGRASALSFYVWVKVYGVLLPSQFWLLSEEFLDPRQAKRLFGPIGAGGILGGIAGSAAAGILPGLMEVETTSLLGIAGIVVVGAFVVLGWIMSEFPSARAVGLGRETDASSGDEPGLGRVHRLERPDRDKRSPQKDTLTSRTPQGRALIFTIAAILIVATTTHTIVDWQFNKVAEQHIADLDGRTAFFGLFFTVLNIVTLIVQVLATSFVLRFFGVGVALAILPVALATGAVGILLSPNLWTASFARGADDSLRYSVDQSGRELLFLPIPSAERQWLKPRIDLMASRAANGIGGVLILLAIWLFDDPLGYLSMVSLALIGGWAILVYRARRQYAGALQQLLEVRDIDVRQIAQSRLDAAASEAIRQGLGSHDRDTTRAALALAARTDPEAFIEEIREVLRTSDDAELKGEALHVLAEAQDSSALIEARANIDPSDRELTAEALAYACAAGDPEAGLQVERYLQGDDPLLAVAAAVCLLEHSAPEQQSKGVAILQQGVAVDSTHGVDLKIAIIDLIRRRPGVTALRPILETLLEDEAPQVARAALASCANYQHPELIPAICRAGMQRNLQSAALQALQILGNDAAGPLTGLLADPRNHRSLRTLAARALGRTGGSQSAAGLIAGLVADDRHVRRATLQALNYMRRRGEKLDIGRDAEASAIRIEWRDYLSLHRLAAALGSPSTDSATAFVATVVGERLWQAEEQLFRALALRHPIQAVFFAYRGLITGDGAARAHAIELVDSVVETPERRTLVRLLETDDRRERGRIAATELGREIPGTEAALHELLDPGDPWLAACAVRALEIGPDDLPRGRRQDLMAHHHPALTELLSEAPA